MDLGFDLRVWALARHRLVPEERKPPPIERGEGEQIERAEVRAERAEQPQEIRSTSAGSARRLVDDPDGAGELCLLLAGDDADEADDEALDDLGWQHERLDGRLVG